MKKLRVLVEVREVGVFSYMEEKQDICFLGETIEESILGVEKALKRNIESLLERGLSRFLSNPFSCGEYELEPFLITPIVREKVSTVTEEDFQIENINLPDFESMKIKKVK